MKYVNVEVYDAVLFKANSGACFTNGGGDCGWAYTIAAIFLPLTQIHE